MNIKNSGIFSALVYLIVILPLNIHAATCIYDQSKVLDKTQWDEQLIEITEQAYREMQQLVYNKEKETSFMQLLTAVNEQQKLLDKELSNLSWDQAQYDEFRRRQGAVLTRKYNIARYKLKLENYINSIYNSEKLTLLSIIRDSEKAISTAMDCTVIIDRAAIAMNLFPAMDMTENVQTAVAKVLKDLPLDTKVYGDLKSVRIKPK